jgi:hypothetical protein
MDRRKFLAAAAVVTVAGGVVAGGVVAKAAVAQADLAQLFADLQALQGKQVQSSGVWSASEVFQHCAASIQGSMQGYPVHKSAIFKASAGKVAFTVFQAAGAMRHSLSEVIPGMPVLDAKVPFAESLTQLLATLQMFIDFSGQLQPHFAYGELSYADYALAHQMHIRNHLGEFIVT